MIAAALLASPEFNAPADTSALISKKDAIYISLFFKVFKAHSIYITYIGQTINYMFTGFKI